MLRFKVDKDADWKALGIAAAEHCRASDNPQTGNAEVARIIQDWCGQNPAHFGRLKDDLSQLIYLLADESNRLVSKMIRHQPTVEVCKKGQQTTPKKNVAAASAIDRRMAARRFLYLYQVGGMRLADMKWNDIDAAREHLQATASGALGEDEFLARIRAMVPNATTKVIDSPAGKKDDEELREMLRQAKRDMRVQRGSSGSGDGGDGLLIAAGPGY